MRNRRMTAITAYYFTTSEADAMQNDYILFSEFFFYDPSSPSGLVWKRNKQPCIKAGQIAGKIDGDYYRIWFNGKRYRAHRIVWLIKTKSWPIECIDHIDHNTLNNKIENLRECTRGENKQNERIRKDNKCGYKGVYWYKLTGKWRSVISVNKKRISLGLFDTPEAAHQARLKAAKKLHPFNTD